MQPTQSPALRMLGMNLTVRATRSAAWLVSACLPQQRGGKRSVQAVVMCKLGEEPSRS